ncbi:MAG: hypothetical protein M5U34_08455 [Chloroflexi bacterium]|nr:hypothetical protein [Chloroflexota bacterium]
MADNGRLDSQDATPPLLLSGSFNPLHDGHLDMARIAAEMAGQPAAFELSAANADKPPLARKRYRTGWLSLPGGILFTPAPPPPLWKNRIYPGATFVVGFDTAMRILQPRFYADNPANMYRALTEIRERGCRFMVAGRTDENGRFRQAADLPLPLNSPTSSSPSPTIASAKTSLPRNLEAAGGRESVGWWIED